MSIRLLFVIFLILGIAFVTLCERHMLGSSQIRLGPNKISFMGFVQPLWDGLKLFKKEMYLSQFSSNVYFFLFPLVLFILILLYFTSLPLSFAFISFEFSLLFFLCLLGCSIYIILIIGLFSKSKYGIIGSLRSSSQSISYEIAFSILIMVIFFNWKSFFITKNMSIRLLFIIFLCLIFVLAELGRPPFDFPEGERELVSGYNIEYGRLVFVFLFLGEYGFLLFFSLFMSIVFINFNFLFFCLIFLTLVWIRSSFPRFRYDFLMLLL